MAITKEKKYKRSPIFYMGNKFKLLDEIIPLFPKNIEIFYDLFGGSGVVSLNVNASKIVLNELDENIYNIYKTLRKNHYSDIVNHIEKQIIYYNLPTISTDNRKKDFDLSIRERYKKNYIKFRAMYNKSKNPLDLFVLMNYALSQTMRFNSKGEFNMPFGNGRFIKEKHSQYYKDFYEMANDNLIIFNKNYKSIINGDNYGKNDFVYLDPPYSNTTATYNENGKWTIQDDLEMFKHLETLDKKGVKWGLSNVFENKGVCNTHLIEWCEKNNWNVHYINHTYSSLGKGNSQNKEVFITNYKV